MKLVIITAGYGGAGCPLLSFNRKSDSTNITSSLCHEMVNPSFLKHYKQIYERYDDFSVDPSQPQVKRIFPVGP
ncbi:hypothetical protein BDV41DRAFT_552839 [Aspergillus transmontanensis]|uniref:Uncharacterized protein n=1 Tax=Aspergillus transmontanensis TaxID=1034304 RepID=A0A5N6VIL0_9EURO|nr:hypothetical protein BDV41DRAFT_552839 [Aspergillus transmontanensis]